MDMEAQTIRNTEDIGKLTVEQSKLTGTVNELATMFKYEAERSKEERAAVKDVLTELKGINEKIGNLAEVQKDVARLDGEIGKQRHDIKNIENAQQGMGLLGEKVNTSAKDIEGLRTKYENIKEWKDKHDLSNYRTRIETLETSKLVTDGEKKAIKSGGGLLWAIFGPIITGMIMAGMTWYFTSQQPPYSRTSTTIERKGHSGGVTTGE